MCPHPRRDISTHTMDPWRVEISQLTMDPWWAPHQNDEKNEKGTHSEDNAKVVKVMKRS